MDILAKNDTNVTVSLRERELQKNKVDKTGQVNWRMNPFLKARNSTHSTCEVVTWEFFF